jgi:HAD superfamily hydrolase (TIGR01509 family)
MEYKLGLASNAVRNSVHTMLEKANIIGYFDVILSNQDVKRAKPDPEIYSTAIASLHMEPQQCLVIEDNDKGIRAAKAANAHLMIVNSVYDVTLTNILEHINRIERETL